MAPDGCIYAFPSHAPRVLKIDCMAGTVKQIGPEFEGRYKWGGGAVGLDGNVYGMPSDIDVVLRINCATEEVDTIGHGKLPSYKNKWQGAVLAPDGALYAIPGDADSVLKIVPETGEVSLVGQVGDAPDKWQGGFLGEDGIIYGIPENADQILRIIPPKVTKEGLSQVKAAAAASGAAAVGAVPAAAQATVQKSGVAPEAVVKGVGAVVGEPSTSFMENMGLMVVAGGILIAAALILRARRT